MASHFGNNPSFAWECPLTQTGKRSAHSTCAKEFAKELGFQLIETSDDGNCFFYALTKFGKRSEDERLFIKSSEHKNAFELRQQLVDYIDAHFEDYSHFLVNNNSESVNEQIQGLRKNGVWASDAGDLVPVAAANAFGININLYDIVIGNEGDRIHLVPIRSQTPSSIFVSLMRVREGHFQLLWPRSGKYHSVNRNAQLLSKNRFAQSAQSAQSAHSNSNQDAIYAAHLAVEAAQISLSSVKKVISNQSNTSMSSSLMAKNEQKLNQMIHNLNQLSIGGPRRSTRSTRSTTMLHKNHSPLPVKVKQNTRRKKKSPIPSSTSYLNNNNELRRALEESMYNQ